MQSSVNNSTYGHSTTAANGLLTIPDEPKFTKTKTKDRPFVAYRITRKTFTRRLYIQYNTPFTGPNDIDAVKNCKHRFVVQCLRGNVVNAENPVIEAMVTSQEISDILMKLKTKGWKIDIWNNYYSDSANQE